MTDKIKYTMIESIALLNSAAETKEHYMKLFDSGLFSDPSMWEGFKLTGDIPGIMDKITSRKKYYMSKLSLGVYNIIENGPGRDLKKDEEIYLFSGFTEIETISKIGNMFVENNYSINPAVFPNSVHHISLCYYTILKNHQNYCATVTDGLMTNKSFIDFIKYRTALAPDFIIISGEEDSGFFHNEIKNVLNIVPSFVSYRVKPFSDKGFYYKGRYASLELLKNGPDFINASNIFTDRITFKELAGSVKGKKLYSEYPIVKDNPCGIAVRLAMPFYFGIKGQSLVIDLIENNYHLFAVDL